VLSINEYNNDNNDINNITYNEAFSLMFTSKKLKYEIGQEIRESEIDLDVNKECCKGIHVHKYKDHCFQWFKKEF